MTQTACRKVLISGKVQGVFFRLETQKAARKAGVSGYVRNLPDGSVEAVFQGSPEKVDQMITWCRNGPPASRVDQVTCKDILIPPDYHHFERKR